MTLPLTKKYAPKSSSEIPQKTAVAQLKMFIQEYKKQKKKAALIYGPAGTCKTSTVYAIAKELGLETIEVNASDVRNSEGINEVLGNALKQQSLFYKGKLILMDEVDGVSGTNDRGGIQELTKLIEESKFPIILTANDPWDKKFSTLRSKSVMIQFQSLNYRTIRNVLKDICEKEKIECDEDNLNILALRCGGDLRAAINDLQSSISKNKLTKEEVESVDARNKVDTIIDALTKVLKSTDAQVAISAFNNVNEDTDKIMLWLDENLPKEYKN
ncbi:replication factor C large subunit, partial [archaeon]|nr:replication factor C large subunit [archaeon]